MSECTHSMNSSLAFGICSGIAFFFNCSVLGCLCLGQVVRMDEQGPGIVDRVVILSEDKFSLDKVETLAHKFVVQNDRSSVLYRLTVVANEDDLELCFLGKRFEPSEPYERVLELLHKKGLPRTPIAQAIGIRDSMILRYRDSSGLKEKMICGDSDPTIFRAMGRSYHFLHFRVFDGGSGNGASHRYTLAVFMRVSGPLSFGGCMDITKQWVSLTPVKNVTVSFRPDCWFLEDPAFPYVYQFDESLRIPDEAEYSLPVSASCSKWVGSSYSCGSKKFSQ